jgi:vitamin B12 transporter
MKVISLARVSGRFLVILPAVAVGSLLRAQDVAASDLTLDRYVVSASRSPQEPSYVSSSVTSLSLPELATAQIPDLRTALATVPGVGVINTGGAGGQSSVFLRGANSYQTLFIVDGVRINDRAAAYYNFLAGADLGGIDRIEVLRGPQSTLYGSSAMGGVILIDTAHGSGPLRGAMSGEVGTFDTWSAALAAQGGVRNLGYSAAVSRIETANDLPANDYRNWAYSARVEGAPTDALLVGATFRGQGGDYEDVGSRVYPSTARVETDAALATVYAQARVGETLTSRLTLAQHRRDYTYTTFGPWGAVSSTENRRAILDWQTTWHAANALEVVGGLNFERSRYLIDDAKTTDNVGAGFLSATIKPTASVVITGGLRYDDFDSAGDAVTWRTGLTWRPAHGTKLRATYGTGFGAPGTDDRYGVPQWGQLANPDLKPEKSRGWDVGIDQELLNGRTTVTLTYFQNKFRDLFEWEYLDYVTYEGHIVNRSRATTAGIELATTARLTDAVKTRLAYTYLEADNDGDHTRLIRRPRHAFDGDLQFQATKAWLVGAGLHLVADRIDGGVAMEDYTTVRLFSSFALRENVRLKLRVENALNEHYEETFGYPALPIAVYGGAEWRF